jgi:hypothetical protein
MMVREAMNGYLDIFRQYKKGDIGQDTLDTFGLPIYASIPGVAHFLESQREILEPGLWDYLASAPQVDAETAYSIIMGGPARGA